MSALPEGKLPHGGELLWNAGRRIALYRYPETGALVRSRDYAELFCMVRGSSRHRIGSSEVTVEQGELLLLGQNTPLELLPLEPGAIAVSFLMKPELFGDILSFLGTEETPLREFLLRCLGQESPYGYLHFRVGGVVPVQNLLENLLLHLLEKPDSRRAIPMYTVGLLFVQLLEESDKLTMGIREQQAILGVLRYLETNYVGGSLTDAAQLLHCDVAWLSREIKRRTAGLTRSCCRSGGCARRPGFWSIPASGFPTSPWPWAMRMSAISTGFFRSASAFLRRSTGTTDKQKGAPEKSAPFCFLFQENIAVFGSWKRFLILLSKDCRKKSVLL